MWKRGGKLQTLQGKCEKEGEIAKQVRGNVKSGEIEKKLIWEQGVCQYAIRLCNNGPAEHLKLQ